MSIAGVWGALYEDQLYQAQKLKEMTTQAEILAASVTAALAFDDKATAQQYTNALRANPELEVAVVYDGQGKILAQFVRPGARLPPANPALSEGRFRHNHIEIAVPVAERGQLLGKVYLSGSMDSLQRRLLKYGIIALIAAMAALFLGALGAAQFSLSKANRQLAEQARDLAKANATLQNEMHERSRIEDALRQSQVERTLFGRRGNTALCLEKSAGLVGAAHLCRTPASPQAN
ncbi:MAG TPA: CHASE sensor domain-containing protein [Rhizomicrobium sp.]|nr:CHASE sensor domain-containing protein [Rhizomicrobium sp.]